MTTEKEDAQQEEAAFASGFSGEPIKEPKAPEPAKPEATKEDVKPEEVKDAAPAPSPTLTTEEITALREAAKELPAMRGQLRDAHGRIGALNDLLKQTREQKKDEGKPATLTAVELKRLKEKYPELSEDLSADISEALASLRTTASNPEDIAKLVTERVAEADHASRKQMLADEHPDWEDIKKGKDLWDWIATLSKEDAHAFQNSANPLYVARKLTVFKDWLAAKTKAKEKSQERLEAAITPTGVPRAGKSTMSDDEAMQKGFAEGFNS